MTDNEDVLARLERWAALHVITGLENTRNHELLVLAIAEIKMLREKIEYVEKRLS